MSPESKNKDWQPTATVETLRARARFLRAIRDFFESRDVMEVETPLLCATGALDPYLDVISAQGGYLQTSPEYGMKRLLAAGCGSIYQLCKAFRGEESGRLHNPEFTMLEWYRVGFTHHQLMDEMDALLGNLLGASKADRLSYSDLFQKALGFNPHTVSIVHLQEVAMQVNITLSAASLEGLRRDDWLDLLMTHHLEPTLGLVRPLMLYDYPHTQAALAKLRQDHPEVPPVGERFEVYIQGIELANGYHELTDSTVQRVRFQEDRNRRAELGVMPMQIDNRLMQALEHGLPACAGVALGVDRLFMLKMGFTSIHDVLAFPGSRA